MPDMDEFLERLASREPVPGGGSVAGLEVAMGAALLSMVCELTLGRDKYASVAGEIEQIRRKTHDIRLRAAQLVQEDAVAFSDVSRVMKMPRATDEEKFARRESMQQALKAAVAPPLETMQRGFDGMELAIRLAPIGNPSAASDVGSGALCFEAGFHAARLNVEINLAAIKDSAFVRDVRERMPQQGRITTGREEVMLLVEQEIGAP